MIRELDINEMETVSGGAMTYIDEIIVVGTVVRMDPLNFSFSRSTGLRWLGGSSAQHHEDYQPTQEEEEEEEEEEESAECTSARADLASWNLIMSDLSATAMEGAFSGNHGGSATAISVMRSFAAEADAAAQAVRTHCGG